MGENEIKSRISMSKQYLARRRPSLQFKEKSGEIIHSEHSFLWN
jgi:hypothetical protein